MSGFDYGDSPFEKSIDVFISYRRSNGSQLARSVSDNHVNDIH